MLARLSVLLGKINPALGELWGIQLGIFLLVTVLTGLFLAGYLLQGTRVGIQLWLAVRRLEALAHARSVEPAAVAAALAFRPFDQLWDEYCETLHEVRSERDGPVELRATVPAEMFFTREALVDGRLFDEFTRRGTRIHNVGDRHRVRHAVGVHQQADARDFLSAGRNAHASPRCAVCRRCGRGLPVAAGAFIGDGALTGGRSESCAGNGVCAIAGDRV